mmetsp:Transcript_39571/g.112228  ORF Transcript_39571/g.112228 Transcript_39571/m.112228 type:complete len:297 (-) Transcript_39571:1502-2392(-)|eukprot:CAMPEP_0117671562 /NCGR_PEP_ID=MMETSP0804-20121206/13403_1 /TAXON_ID=1074897 /ORGANISM="Tetraselmis astigmatica, Strain CCMP880" /LENGTH=296 /DNA_ID=CAMNT_0005480037 /DNA_START=159 /DNA_END=1049 /DNA_ORIENTATION=-
MRARVAAAVALAPTSTCRSSGPSSSRSRPPPFSRSLEPPGRPQRTFRTDAKAAPVSEIDTSPELLSRGVFSDTPGRTPGEMPPAGGSPAVESFLRHWRGENKPAPKELGEVLLVFFTHPSVLAIVTALTCLGSLRLGYLVTWADATVSSGICSLWLLQEWVIHAKLLHSSFDWMGKRIHESHHAEDYFHISIDPPGLILPAMALSAGVFYAAMPTAALGLTATLTYFLMGLLYEFNHYLVHTRYIPKNSLGRAIRRNHMLHHNRNPNYWLSFTLPSVDDLFGTNPKPATVPHDPMN